MFFSSRLKWSGNTKIKWLFDIFNRLKVYIIIINIYGELLNTSYTTGKITAFTLVYCIHLDKILEGCQFLIVVQKIELICRIRRQRNSYISSIKLIRNLIEWVNIILHYNYYRKSLQKLENNVEAWKLHTSKIPGKEFLYYKKMGELYLSMSKCAGLHIF